MTCWFTSDTHFYHANIIKYCNRPFKTVAEMNTKLFNNWNEAVGKEDTIYHLGDVGFCSQDRLKDVIERLPGYKILVLGNHDRKKEWMQKTGFDEVVDWVDLALDDEKGTKVYLSHYPYYDPADTDQRRASKRLKNDNYRWLLCGHVHDKWKVKGHMINVGVDVWDFKPVSLAQIKEIIYAS